MEKPKCTSEVVRNFIVTAPHSDTPASVELRCIDEEGFSCAVTRITPETADKPMSVAMDVSKHIFHKDEQFFGTLIDEEIVPQLDDPDYENEQDRLDVINTLLRIHLAHLTISGRVYHDWANDIMEPGIPLIAAGKTTRLVFQELANMSCYVQATVPVDFDETDLVFRALDAMGVNGAKFAERCIEARRSLPQASNEEGAHTPTFQIGLDIETVDHVGEVMNVSVVQGAAQPYLVEAGFHYERDFVGLTGKDPLQYDLKASFVLPENFLGTEDPFVALSAGGVAVEAAIPLIREKIAAAKNNKDEG